MISFKEFSVRLLNEEKRVHTHSTHIEDLLFVDGKSGLERTLKAFDDIKNSFGTTDISDNRILSTKIDGCVDADTLVVTKDGDKKISELTNEDIVKCYDTDTKSVKWCDKTNPRITGNSKEFIELTFDNGGKLICTKDHPILDINCEYQEAETLNREEILTL